MRAVVQRVKKASVEVDGKVVGEIGQGFLVLLGVAHKDTKEDVDWMVEKVLNLRIFENEEGKFDRSLLDIDGDLLVVSQFTLYGDCSKGRRPSFSSAMEPHKAKELYDLFIAKAKERVKRVESGIFQAMMDVHLVNQGPVTLIIESP
ncbi:MAG: D-aminoacyl-tRNA deacylase [Syntrophorhabdaceae bacterium]|nr:D-aminoacyl-tRNA deacylase [Syntrophorhabdaceae bacterium]